MSCKIDPCSFISLYLDQYQNKIFLKNDMRVKFALGSESKSRCKINDDSMLFTRVAVFHTADVRPHEHVREKAPDSAALLMGTHFLPWSVSGSIFKQKSKSNKWPWKASRSQKAKEAGDAIKKQQIGMMCTCKWTQNSLFIRTLYPCIRHFPYSPLRPCIPHAATVAKQMVYSSIHSCQVFLFIYLFIYLLFHCYMRVFVR